jgi:hypothetical protein
MEKFTKEEAEALIAAKTPKKTTRRKTAKKK